MEERFTMLKILIPRHSPISESLLETISNQQPMPVTETLMLDLTFILGPMYERTMRLEPLTIGVRYSESVWI